MTRADRKLTEISKEFRGGAMDLKHEVLFGVQRVRAWYWRAVSTGFAELTQLSLAGQ